MKYNVFIGWRKKHMNETFTDVIWIWIIVETQRSVQIPDA